MTRLWRLSGNKGGSGGDLRGCETARVNTGGLFQLAKGRKCSVAAMCGAETHLVCAGLCN